MTIVIDRAKVALGVAGEAQLVVAQVECDGCGVRAARAEGFKKDQAVDRAIDKALDVGFVAHTQDKRWLCPRCRLLSLPEHLQARFPRLMAEHAPARPRRRRRSR
jgi:hypothetical protein